MSKTSHHQHAHTHTQTESLHQSLSHSISLRLCTMFSESGSEHKQVDPLSAVVPLSRNPDSPPRPACRHSAVEDYPCRKRQRCQQDNVDGRTVGRPVCAVRVCVCCWTARSQMMMCVYLLDDLLALARAHIHTLHSHERFVQRLHTHAPKQHKHNTRLEALAALALPVLVCTLCVCA